MTDYLDQTKWEWAHQRRVSPWPLVRLVIVVFCLGVCFGVALSFAFSALSSSSQPWTRGTPNTADQLAVPVVQGTALGGSAVRADSLAELPAAAGPVAGEHLGGPNAMAARTTPAARTTSLEDTSTVIEPIAQSIEQIVTNAAIEFGVSPAWLLRVARCESGPSLDVNAIGDGGRSLSIFQYQAATFLEHARESGLGYDLTDLTDPIAQSRTAAWAFANGRSQAWTCR